MMEENKELEVKKVHPEETLLSWDAAEYVEHERDAKWFIVAGILTLGLFAYSLYTRDWFFAAVIVVLVIVSLKYLRMKPVLRRYGITRTGIHVDDKFYSYDQLHSFWIVFQPPVKSLHILTNRKYLPVIDIQIMDQDSVLIKSILKKFIPEQEKRGEAPMDKLSRMLRF